MEKIGKHTRTKRGYRHKYSWAIGYEVVIHSKGGQVVRGVIERQVPNFIYVQVDGVGEVRKFPKSSIYSIGERVWNFTLPVVEEEEGDE